MLLDCAIIGGGPAGLNAALVLGRARRNVVLFDDNKPRNAVTQESHGFITRDGIRPSEFRRAAHQDIAKYPSVRMINARIADVRKGETFYLTTDSGLQFQARKIIIATGLKETLPSVHGIHEFYGKSLFNCPYCDGWEQKDKPLIIIADKEYGFHMAMTVFNWSQDLLVCTNGSMKLTPEQKETLLKAGIMVNEQKIASLVGANGVLEAVVFEDGTEVKRSGGFITVTGTQTCPFGKSLGCETNEMGGIATDGYGRTSIEGVYAAGDTSVVAPSQLIIAAAEGSRAAIGVNSDLTQEQFDLI